jgi:hypothetical protein
MGHAAFTLGDHQFISPEENAPLSRLDQANRKPIRGATPPAHLAGVAVEARGDGPSSSLMNGEFCGHGEPTFTVFDVEIDGSRDIELAVETDEEIDEEEMEEDDEGPMIRRVLARRAGSDGPWTVLHDVTWGMDEEAGRTFPWCPPEPEMDDDDDIQPVETEEGEAETFRVSIGLEYPPDAQSTGDVSWVAIVAVGTEQVGEEVFCVVSEEMA